MSIQTFSAKKSHAFTKTVQIHPLDSTKSPINYPQFCETHEISVIARPRALTESELMKYGLPYLIGVQKLGGYDYSNLGIGQSNTQLNNGLQNGGKSSVVLNGEAPFAYDLDLPAQSTVRSVNSVVMHAGMTNVRRKPSHLTQKNTIELLCLLEDRICSGVCYDTDASYPSVNNGFWSASPAAELPNSNFSTALDSASVSPAVAYGADLLQIFQHPFVELDMTKMLEGSSEDITKMLYRGDENRNAPCRKALILSVGNNTFVQWSYIVAKLSVESCHPIFSRFPR